ncbi:MAG: hypothetical protein ABI867_15125 [Kofleriaceae bacterium]
MTRRAWILTAMVTAALLVLALYTLRDRDDSIAPAARSASPLDKLRERPLRTRWAPPLCKPAGIARMPDGAPARDAAIILHAARLARGVAGDDTLEATTGADGAFVLPATPAGTWILVAALPGHRAGTRRVVIAAATDCANLDIALGPPAHPVTGTITDVSGGPVRGAIVVARPANMPGGPPLALAVARADGRYEFAADAGDYAITVRHPQYVGVDGRLSVKGPTTFDAVLTPGSELRGIVLTRDRREPVPGARVTIRGGRASGAMGGLAREVTTGEDGRFAVTGLGSGRAWIAAVGPNHASRDPVEIALGIAESRDEVEVLVDPARRIRGVVTHEGRAANDAVVSAYLGGDAASGADMRMEMLALAGDRGELTAETDADGVFELWGLTPGTYEVIASGPHTLPSPRVHADVTKVDVDGLELALATGIAIRGRVEPPQVATVTLGGWSLETSAFVPTASEMVTAADGVFEIHVAEPGEVTVYGYTTGANGEVVVDVPVTGASGVVVALAKRGVTVTGRVSDTHGRPVPGVFVAGWTAITSSDGTFTATTEPGQYALSVTDAEELLAVLAPKLPGDTITVPAGGLTDLAITVEARDRTMRGVVVGADGKPAADAWVVAAPLVVEAPDAPPPDLSRSAFDWSGRNRIALTDADGRFAIANLKAGTYEVSAEGDKGNARGVTRGVTPDRPVRVQLVALGGLTVTATASDGKPLARYELELSGPEPDQRTVTAGDGRITLTGLPPGDYAIKVVTDTGAAKAAITLAQGASAQAVLVVGGWATVTGQVVDKATGKPLEGIPAFVADALLDSNGDSPAWITNTEGRFTIARVPPGHGEVLIFTGSGEGEHVAFAATAGARVDVGIIRVDAPPPSPPDDGPDVSIPGADDE